MFTTICCLDNVNPIPLPPSLMGGEARGGEGRGRQRRSGEGRGGENRAGERNRRRQGRGNGGDRGELSGVICGGVSGRDKKGKEC